jgi:ribonuclease VapC
MILDTSALFAVVLGEPDAERYLEYMLNAQEPEISAATLLEARIIARRRNVEKDLEELLSAIHRLAVAPFDEDLSSIAFQAYKTYGPPHPAKLNFGDCFSYATARQREKPLLFQGQEFTKTDVVQSRSGEVRGY